VTGPAHDGRGQEPQVDPLVPTVERSRLEIGDHEPVLQVALDHATHVAQGEGAEVHLGGDQHLLLARDLLSEHESGDMERDPIEVEGRVEGPLEGLVPTLARGRPGRGRVVAPSRPHPHALARHPHLDPAEAAVAAPHRGA
jgi:hypothetical protein